MRSAIQSGHWGIKEASPAPAPAAPEPAPVLPVFSPAPRAPARWSPAALLLSAVGLALAGVGMVETVAYSWNIGGEVFAALAVSADLLGLVMPAVAAALWRSRKGPAIGALLLWVIGCTATVANLSGYIGTHDDAFTSQRQVQALNRATTIDRREQLRAERAKISELRPVQALEVAVKNARRSARPELQQALAIAQRRDAIDAELLKPLTAGNTTTADPSAAVLSQITGASIAEADVRRVRLLAWLLLPLCGGGVLSLAFALRRS